MSNSKLRIRVDLGPDGKTPSYELLHNGLKICDLSFVDVVEFLTQAASSLRWERERMR
ncbi:hypothetical protein LB553_01265 [Mesorhizobium sp. CA8]|uniref:hypothetical protein n=1 Tax=Mesorhizobium sp. CA8 TaxID=2876637 RepID=UPI001CC90B23|nr:hypothetical protein [Mesorhizobium sp. CA8]MBZ9759516.1 hypothetical protein [Mesorhizobium sp. CA8]